MYSDRGQEFIDQLTKELRIAINSLVRVGGGSGSTETEVDYSRLIAKIAAATSLNADDYTEASWTNLYAVVVQAAYALESKDQEVVDAAAQAIDDAIAALVPRPVNPDPTVDYTALIAAIETARSLKEANYTAESWTVLADALTAAGSALDSTDQAVVDAAAKALNDAIAGLVENPDNPPPTIDYTKLAEQIARAEALDETKYTEETWERLEYSLETARNALTSKVQAVVDGAALALQSAIEGLEEKNPTTPNPPSLNGVDYTELNAQIGIAKALLERNYTPESWRNMTEALAVAEAALSSNEQSFVDSAAENLKTAIGALVVIEEDNTPNMLWLVIVLSSIIVAIVAAVVIAMIIKKKREKDLTPLVDYDIEDDNN